MLDVRGRLKQAVHQLRTFSFLRQLLRHEQDLRLEAETLERRYRQLVQSLPAAVYTCDARGCITLYNQAAVELWGNEPALHEDAWCGTPHLQRTDGSPLSLEDSPMGRVLRDGRSHPREEIVIQRPDGSRRNVLAHSEVLLGPSGEIAGAMHMLVDITDLRRAEQALRESDRRKDEFLAILAHELRNPLAPLRNGLQIMRLAPGDHDAVERAREMMERQMVQLVRLTDDLLDVSRIQRGKVELRREVIDVAAVLRTAVESSRPLIDEADHTLDLRVPAEAVFVNADPVRLAQVFSNLLNNAAKYTPPGGRLGVVVERDAGDVVVSVRDNGVGMDPHALSIVFDMFTQLDRSHGKPHEGLGLGLTIVKQMVEMHDGSVSARSDGVGKGSEFRVRLPAVEGAKAAARPLDAIADAAASRRVLIADDSKDSADSLAILLEHMGHEVRTEHEGHAAIARAESFRPDLVLLDIGMPGLSGLEICERIRSQPWGKAMSIVALTGWGQEADRERSRQAGFDHHLVKPVELERLSGLLASATPKPSADDVAAAP